MSAMISPAQSNFLCEMNRLLRAQMQAKDDEERDAADHAMGLLLRYNASGRLEEYFALLAARSEQE